MAKVQKVEREMEIRKAAQKRYAPCPDHNGKAPGGCLMCEIERLRGVIEAQVVDLDLLLHATREGDPNEELRVRAEDMKRRLTSQKGGEK